MFEDLFKTQLSHFTGDEGLREKLWREIESNYSKPGRYYHALPHLDSLVFELSNVRHEIEDWSTLIFSVAYHDIIYNTLRQDNEERSARFAARRLTALSVAGAAKEKCMSQIMATKTHGLSGDRDTNYFVDADLSILGANAEAYLQYSRMIRKEFRYYPDLVYKPGRRKVLQSFLSRPMIYKTDFFQNKYEEQARVNLEAELRELTK